MKLEPLQPTIARPPVDIELQQVPPTGAVVEVRINGRIVATQAISRGSHLRIQTPLTAGQDHLMEVVPLTAGTVAPGAVLFTAGPPA